MVRKLQEGNSLCFLLSNVFFHFLCVGVVPVYTFFCMDVGSLMYTHYAHGEEA